MQTGAAPCGAAFLLRTAQAVTSQAGGVTGHTGDAKGSGDGKKKRRRRKRLWWLGLKRMERNTEISNKTTKLARQFNPNTYRMKV
jgi:hypothetical protein